ncbi:amino acid ABC transporter permease [Arthrobacter bambusae]|uniref:amino acid ABC transporter permease n=1 Tax=Arthrobacter bambusae TaxID=1338426 RepID=UPI002788A560|nr:amino acid ABC transporter permease [Arthrobacter bambusae]MDQ0029936.1 polar amino acid transport system permease protein [Arthrobacter bambusae]MDQ0097546.1 polar amino acid transport system permease protein [Arthrobacter bambusae]
MSPPPKSGPLAVAAVIFAGVLLLLMAGLGAASMGNSTPGSTTSVIGWLISTVGVVSAGIVLWIAARSVRRSLHAARDVRAGRILEARTPAAMSIQDSLLTFGIGLAILIVLAAAIALTVNDGVIQKTFLRWDLIGESARDVVSAFGLNVMIAVISEVFILVFGLILAIARMMPGRAGRPIRAIAIAYIDGMRAVPAIIIIYLVGFGLPLLKIPVLSDLPPEWFAITALTLSYSAYVAETYRAGIEVIHPSQWSASRSLGFSYGRTLRYVILPQAIRGVIPPLLSMFIALQKDTSLVNVIGTLDAFNQAKFYSSASFNLSSVTLVAVLFIIITIPQTRVVDWLLSRSGSHRRPKGGK